MAKDRPSMIPYIVGKMTMLNKIDVACSCFGALVVTGLCVVQIAGKPVRNFDHGWKALMKRLGMEGLQEFSTSRSA